MSSAVFMSHRLLSLIYTQADQKSYAYFEKCTDVYFTSVHCYLEFHFKGQPFGTVGIKHEPGAILILDIELTNLVPACEHVL